MVIDMLLYNLRAVECVFSKPHTALQEKPNIHTECGGLCVKRL